MRKIVFYLFLLNIVFLLVHCVNPGKIDKAKGSIIDFGDIKSMKATELISDYFYVPLESSDSSLLGNISQIEIFNDKIYILDNSKMNALYVFTIDGKFIMKLESAGSGPGEFISPHSFWIDKSGFIFILDRQLNRLLKYQLSDLKFLDVIALPSPSPLSFAVIPHQNLYLYYYPLRQNDVFSGKQYIIADSAGSVVNSFYDAPPTGKILHGNSANFYLFNDHIRTYPHFSNEVYELNDNSFNSYYAFSWGNLGFPPTELFQKYNNSGEVMKEVLTGDNNWIRLLYVYEQPQLLVVKYYVKKDLYLSIWNKSKDEAINVKSEKIIDDLGIGGKFPLPVTVYKDKFVGAINPFDIVVDDVKDERLVNLIDGNLSEENNPILVFYTINDYLDTH